MLTHLPHRVFRSEASNCTTPREPCVWTPAMASSEPLPSGRGNLPRYPTSYARTGSLSCPDRYTVPVRRSATVQGPSSACSQCSTGSWAYVSHICWDMRGPQTTTRPSRSRSISPLTGTCSELTSRPYDRARSSRPLPELTSSTATTVRPRSSSRRSGVATMTAPRPKKHLPAPVPCGGSDGCARGSGRPSWRSARTTAPARGGPEPRGDEAGRVRSPPAGHQPNGS